LKIDFFCFSVPNLNSNDYTINEDDNENTIWIKNKEKELMKSAQENDMLILFDRNTKKFYKNFEEFDIQNSIVFPRSFITYEEELLTNISMAGALSIQTKEDCEKITNWPQYIQPIHRRVIPTSYKEFQVNAEKYRLMFNKLFLKTAIKSNIHFVLKFYGHIKLGETNLFFTKPPLFNINSDDTVFLSEAFESIEDQENSMDCREYRVFVLNNSLLSISRSYIDYPTIIPEKVKLFVEKQINRASAIDKFPSSYVLDVGEIKIGDKEVIDIIEYNAISSSGLEVSNHLIERLLQNNKPKKYMK